MPTRIVEHFTLNQEIRETVAWVLFRGCRNADQLPVLVKVLREEYPSPRDIAKLRHEYSTLQSLALPGVARALSLEKGGNGPALVLEDVGGQPLDAILRARRLDLKSSLRLAILLTGVVELIHSQGITHYDIKPHHFFFDERTREVTLVDFWVATRLSQEAQRLAGPGLLEGTLSYMSPEQTGRMNRTLDRRTDLYSLGVTLYELLTGVLPFSTTDPLELVHSHIARTPPSPHQVLPAIPLPLSDIVMKLLSKVAEDRYRDAAGLKADLQACFDQLEQGGEVTAFPLGRFDFSDELRIPQKLYGREAESGVLLTAFQRSRAGAAELLLISGYSGVGKSALVNEIQQQIVRGGHFAAGKFDQLHRSIPYGAIAEACRALLQSVLMEPSERLAAWRRRLILLLGSNAQVIVDLVPELSLVIGPQPPAQELGLSESRHRFEQVFQTFVQALTSAEQPLAFFLDDLQWADAASLRLIHLILTAPRRSHLLVIGAYRDNEVGPVHPLTLAIQDLRKAGATISELRLEPLDRSSVGDLLADVLGAKGERVDLLADLTLRKTHGNPFFLGQFVTELHRNKLLSFNPRARGWTWDLERIEGAMVTDNVVDFMVGRLKRLTPGTQEVLRLAACIGHQFDLRTLSVISERSEDSIGSDLGDALREGFIVSLDHRHPYTLGGGDDPTGDVLAAPDASPTYRFLHDRVQQAAYALIDDAHKQELHARIGRLMLARSANEPKDADLFDVVNHLNLGVTFVVDVHERRVLARLDLAAGLRAKAAAAYPVALKLFRACFDLLGDDPWATDYDIAFPATLNTAQCESVGTSVDEALATLGGLEAHGRTTMDRVAVLEAKLVALTHANRVAEAVVCASQAAKLLGVDFPAERGDFGPAIGAAFGALQGALAGRDVASLVDLPPMRDPEKIAILNIFFKTGPAANQTNPDLTAWMTLKAVALALEYGNAPVSSYFYAFYGTILGIVAQDFGAGYRFGELGLSLNERIESPIVAAATPFLFGAFVSHWHKHLSESIEYLRRGLKAGLNTGDYIHAGYCASIGLAYRFFRGDLLPDLEGDLKGYSELLGQNEDVINSTFVALLERTVANLKGQTESRLSLGGEGCDEAALKQTILSGGNRHLVGNYHLFKATILCLAGDYSGALVAAEIAAAHAIPAFFLVTEQCFWHALAIAGQIQSAPSGEREPLLVGLRKDEDTFRAWAGAAPENHAHRHALIAAELAAATGDHDQAIDLYDRAIALAKEHGFIQVEALANELCGRFHLGRRRNKVGSAYMMEASYAYLRWGATAKVQEISQQYSGLFTRTGSLPTAPTGVATGLTTTTAAMASRLDLASAIRAMQAIASELVLDRLIERLMRILVENAGAQRGFLVFEHDGRLSIEASFAVDSDIVRIDLAQDVEASSELSVAIVQYVARTREAVVLGDASGESRFAADRYIATSRPKSILCVAMLHQGRMAGVLYLENNAATNAFDPARTELLQVLAAQAATAIENANLYGDVGIAKEALLRANETLEAQVTQRTLELNRTLSELWSEMDLAVKVQTVLLPHEPTVPDYEIAAKMITATNVGGDCYDVFRAEGGTGSSSATSRATE